MAISVDNIYRTVLSIINKEQRGYLTPDEFNKIAKQAQLNIIDNNIDMYNMSMNKRKDYTTNNGYGDNVAFYREKLEELTDAVSMTFSGGSATLPTSNDFYRLLEIYSSDGLIRYEGVPKEKLRYVLSSPLATPMASFPIYYFDDFGQTVYVKPSTTALNAATVKVDYIKLPNAPRWGYFSNSSNGVFTFDENIYQEGKLVLKSDAFDTFTSNITGGVDAEYSVDGNISSGGTVSLDVVVSGGVVTSVDVVGEATGLVAGATITVGTYLTGSPEAGKIEVGGVSSDLIITVQEENLYEGSTAGSTNFLLHPSDEPKLVELIMAYAGITISKPEITQLAAQLMQTSQASKQQS